jgi:hypothetical protein
LDYILTSLTTNVGNKGGQNVCRTATGWCFVARKFAVAVAVAVTVAESEPKPEFAKFAKFTEFTGFRVKFWFVKVVRDPHL